MKKKTKDIPICLSCTVCLGLVSVFIATYKSNMVDMINIMMLKLSL